MVVFKNYKSGHFGGRILVFYLLAHLELLQVSLCRGVLSVVRPSVVRPSLTFHVFDISSWTVSRIEVKLNGRHFGSMEIRISKMVAMAVILKFRYPRWSPWRPSRNFSNDISSPTVSPIELKLDGRHHRDSELLKSFRSDIQDDRHGGHLEILQTISPFET